MTPHLSICFSHGGIDKLFSFGGGIKGESVLGSFFVVVVFSPNFPFRIAQIRRQDSSRLNRRGTRGNADVCWLYHSNSEPIMPNLWGFYVSPRPNKFVCPHPRASGDGYAVLGEHCACVRARPRACACLVGETVQQPAACLQRLVLNAARLQDKGFKGAHYLTIVVQYPLYALVHSHMPIRAYVMHWA